MAHSERYLHLCSNLSNDVLEFESTLAQVASEDQRRLARLAAEAAIHDVVLDEVSRPASPFCSASSRGARLCCVCPPARMGSISALDCRCMFHDENDRPRFSDTHSSSANAALPPLEFATQESAARFDSTQDRLSECDNFFARNSNTEFDVPESLALTKPLGRAHDQAFPPAAAIAIAKLAQEQQLDSASDTDSELRQDYFQERKGRIVRKLNAAFAEVSSEPVAPDASQPQDVGFVAPPFQPQQGLQAQPLPPRRVEGRMTLAEREQSKLNEAAFRANEELKEKLFQARHKAATAARHDRLLKKTAAAAVRVSETRSAEDFRRRQEEEQRHMHGKQQYAEVSRKKSDREKLNGYCCSECQKVAILLINCSFQLIYFTLACTRCVFTLSF